MSIHHKVNDELLEFASKVSFDDASNILTINGNNHVIKSKYPRPLFSTTFANMLLLPTNRFILTDLMPWSFVPPKITIFCLFFYWWDGSSSTHYQPRLQFDNGDPGHITITEYWHGTGTVPHGSNNDGFFHQMFHISGLNNEPSGNINSLVLKLDNKSSKIFASIDIYEDFVTDSGDSGFVPVP